MSNSIQSLSKSMTGREYLRFNDPFDIESDDAAPVRDARDAFQLVYDDLKTMALTDDSGDLVAALEDLRQSDAFDLWTRSGGVI